MSKFLLTVCAFGLLLSSAFAREKSPEQLREESNHIWGGDGLKKTDAVAKTDVMLVVLEDGDWEKTKKEFKKWIPTGKKSLHYQTTEHEDCVHFLDKLTTSGVILTLRNLTAIGRVIYAYCILPSGSIMKWPADAPTPTPPE